LIRPSRRPFRGRGWGAARHASARASPAWALGAGPTTALGAANRRRSARQPAALGAANRRRSAWLPRRAWRGHQRARRGPSCDRRLCAEALRPAAGGARANAHERARLRVETKRKVAWRLRPGARPPGSPWRGFHLVARLGALGSLAAAGTALAGDGG
jgi:hypothetical protein